jgi:hypothetical protein
MLDFPLKDSSALDLRRNPHRISQQFTEEIFDLAVQLHINESHNQCDSCWYLSECIISTDITMITRYIYIYAEFVD